MLKRFAYVLGCVALGVVLAPRTAHAEAEGIQIGAGRLHPFLDIDTYFDTAGQITQSTAGGIQYDPDLILHFRPGLKLEVPSEVFSVSLAAALEYLYYIPLNSVPIESGLDRFQGNGDLDIGIFRGAVVGVNVDDHLSRSNITQNPSLPFGLLSLYNDASLAVPINPGGGSLTITPSYHFLLEDYQQLLNVANASTINAAGLDYIGHRIVLENRWRFLPKTALLLDGEYDIRDYLSSTAGNVNLQTFQITTGIAGLITPHVATILRLGYGMDVTDQSVSGLSGLIGQAEVSYLPNEATSLRVGFSRNFQPVASSGTGSPQTLVSYIDNRPYVAGKTQLFGRLALRGTLALDYLTYQEPGGTSPRDDLAFSVDVGADFEVVRWLTISLGDLYVNRTSNQDTIGLSFNDEQVYLRISAHYQPLVIRLPTRLLLGALAVLVSLAACRPPNGVPDRSVPPPAPGSTVTTLGVSDIVEVRVFQETDLTGVYRIGSDGTIDFPFCHRLAVAGRTPSEAAQKITECLKPGYLVNPQVSVDLKEYNSRRISVFGEVTKAGSFPYTSDLNAVQAVLLAGGFTKLAAKNSVTLVRPTDGSEERYKLSVEDMAAGRVPNVMLQPGDILYVPESFF